MYKRRRNLLIFIDIAIFISSYLLTIKLRSISSLFVFVSSINYQLPTEISTLLVLSLGLYFFLLFIFGFYEYNLKIDILSMNIKLIFISFLIFSFLQNYLFIFEIAQIPKSIFITFLILNFLILTTFRQLVYYITNKTKTKNIIVIGNTVDSKKLLKELRRYMGFKIKIYGVILFENTYNNNSLYVYPVLGDITQTDTIIKKLNIDIVFIASEDIPSKQNILKQLDNRLFKNTKFYMYPSNYEIMLGKNDFVKINDIPFISITKNIPNIYNLKRATDLFFSIVLIIFLSPLILFLYILVILSSKGPGIFIQERIGQHQKPFDIYKFRTMKNRSEKVLHQAKKNDKRFTTIGKTLRSLRLDELPQLFNILKGEMSFIGPRPLINKEVAQFKQENSDFKERFIVLPGLSGLAQINGNYHTHHKEKLKYDLWYIYNYSLLLDLTIAITTIKTILLKKGT